MSDYLDPLDTLRDVRDVYRDTLGIRASDIARFQVRAIEDVLSDLDRLAREHLVDRETDPMGSVWYTVSEAGEHVLKEADVPPAADPIATDPLL